MALETETLIQERPCGGSAIRSLPRNGATEEFRRGSTVGPHPKSEPETKDGSSAKNNMPERFKC